MIKDQLITRLAQEPALSDLDERDIWELLKVMEEISLPSQKVLTWEETPVQEFGVILSGEMGVFCGATKERSIGPGDRFGVDELNGDKCWRHTLVTECPTRVLVAEKVHLPVLVNANCHIAALLGRLATPVPARRAVRFNLRRRSRVVTVG